MKITFILHSGYFVELESCCLLFDYYQGEIPRSDKPLYVFASHCHEDHFSPAVFQEARPGRQVRFILSDDIWESRVPKELRESAVFVSPHHTYEVDGLNCWVWDGAPRYQNDQMVRMYREELELLKEKDIDVAFVPLDPRQDADFDLGMRYFFETAGAKRVFPMHMWGDYSVVPLFKADPHYQNYASCLMDVSAPGQVFDI